MTQLAERIKKLRMIMDVSQLVFAGTLGVTRAHISRIETGAVGISNHLIKSICREYGIREEWLRKGKGHIENKFIEIEETIGIEDIKELHERLRRTFYQDSVEKLGLASTTIESVILFLEGLQNVIVKPNNPEAIKFIKAKRQLQKSVNKLQKLFPRKK